jgi:uncharacterized protein YbcI
MSTLDGAVRARISNEMVRLHTEYYGRGPTRAKVYVDGDLVAVVLEDTFTPAEKTLIARGESEGIQDIRRRFQRAMADQFRSIVEQATGREVRSFLSETDLDNDISVELFLLGASRTDMTGFEKAGQEPEAGDQDPASDPGR